MNRSFILAASALALAPRFMLSSDNGGGSGGGGAPKTLEQRLTDATNEATSLREQVNNLTTERDAEKTKATNLQTQFDALTTTANEMKTKLTEAESKLATANSDLATTKSALEAEKKNTERLSTLCGVKGLDPQAAPPTAQQQPEKKTVSQWDAEMKSAANDPVAQAKVAKAYQAALEKDEVL